MGLIKGLCPLSVLDFHPIKWILNHNSENEECGYGLYDLEYMHQCEGTDNPYPVKKLILLLWCPDSAKVKDKMLYSSSFDAIKKALDGVQKYFQATDLSEASLE